MSVGLRKKKLKHGRKSLFLDYKVNSKRKTEFLGLYLVKPTCDAAISHQKMLSELD